MVENDRLQVREPKVLRVRVVAPTAAVAAFSTLTLLGVAALGFASGDLSSAPSSNDAQGNWVVTAPDTVQAVGTLTDQAVARPGSAQGSSVAVPPPAESGSAAASGELPPVAQGGRPGSGVPSTQTTSAGAAAGTSLPVVTPPQATPPQQAGAAAPAAATGELSIHLSMNLLTRTRQSVAENLRAGLRATLGSAKSDDLQQELSSSPGLDTAVTDATSTAVESSLRAAQAVSGPKVAPAEVSQAAAIEFMRVLPEELTRTVHPVVMAALAKTGNEVPSSTLNVVLDGATDDAAEQLSDLALPQVQNQVVALVETTKGEGVPAPTATVTTDPVVVATPSTSDTAPPKVQEPSTTTDTTQSDRGTQTQTPDPDRATTTQPTDEPSTTGDQTAGSRGTGEVPPAVHSTPTSSSTSPTSVDPSAGEGNRVVVVPSVPASPATTPETSADTSAEPSADASAEPSAEPSTQAPAGRSIDDAPSTVDGAQAGSQPTEAATPAPSATTVPANSGNADSE